MNYSPPTIGVESYDRLKRELIVSQVQLPVLSADDSPVPIAKELKSRFETYFTGVSVHQIERMISLLQLSLEESRPRLGFPRSPERLSRSFASNAATSRPAGEEAYHTRAKPATKTPSSLFEYSRRAKRGLAREEDNHFE